MKKFDYYLNASGVTKNEQTKAMLLHLAEEEIQDIFETLGNINKCIFGQVKTKLSDFFKPKKTIAYERHSFRSCRQGKDETMDIIRLKKMAISCEYAEDSVNDMIRDQIHDSCHSTDLRWKFMKEKELTLVKIQEISRASDKAELHSIKETAHHGKNNTRTKWKIASPKRSNTTRVLSPKQQQGSPS